MNGLQGCSRAEVTRAGDGANRLVNVSGPVELLMFVQHWVGSRVGCGRWSGVRGVILVLSYPIVLAFQ